MMFNNGNWFTSFSQRFKVINNTVTNRFFLMNIKHGLVGGKINSTARVGPAGWNCCQRERKLAGP